MSVGTQPELLERDAEVEELTAALEDARAGHGRLVVIEGAAGIGKTRLLRVVREVAEAIGMSVLSARGTELERDFPFAIVRQLLEPALAAEEPERRTERRAGAARPAGAVLGIDQPAASGDVDPSFGTLHALYWLVSNVAESRPTVLAVDDAHWADAASLRCLRFLLTRLEDLPVLLAVAARPPDPAAHADVLAALSADPAADVLRPRELTGPAVAELVRATLAADAHDEFCAACAEATGGNPFLLRELLRELVTEGSAGSAAEAQRVRDVAPASISRSILLRLARLGAPAAQLAAAIAVLGDDASLTHATELAGLERPDALEAADVLAAAGIVEPERPLRFVHPVIRNAIHADLAAGERAAAHERAARILGREHEEPERVAVHLLATDPAGDAQVAETLHAAGTRAIARAAPEAAVRYLRRAPEEAPPTPLRRAILQSLLVAGFRAADLGGAGEEEEAFVELTSEPELLVQSATAVGLYLIGSGRIPEMEALLERAATLAAEAGDPEAAMLFEAQRVTWSHRLPREAYERLAPYAGQVAAGSAGERLWLGAGAWWKSFAPGAAATEAAELAERAVASGDIFDETAGLPQAAQATLVLIRAERLTAAEAAVERFLRVARARGATPEIAGAAYPR